MTEHFKVLYRGGTGELTEKKSRFIATLEPVKTEEEALALIGRLKKQYWDASHNCYAYTLGEHHELTRISDDGEPSQTAGKPMLDVLLGEQLHDVCAVVTRYFGGTLLGTGGLVRAYSGAVKQGLAGCLMTERLSGSRVAVKTGYPDLGKIQYLLETQGIPVLESRFEADVVLNLLVPDNQSDSLRDLLSENTGARCAWTRLGDQYYGEIDKKIVFF